MRSSRRQGTKTVRKDIQGLRALAVLLVFANHIVGWPTGGFAGVDVFFVISGFLITGLLLRDYERTGTISPRKFYLGRLKRIVPSATVVLLFVIGFSWALFTKTRAVSVTWDAFWAFIFGSNWNYAIAGTDYFNQDAAVSPLQHYWSLSVEEQFYFVWPWLLLGLLVVFARFITVDGRRARQIAATTISIIVITSFAWAMYSGATQPTVAYFSTFTRAWELGIGALVAIAAPLLTNIPGIARTVLAYVGLVGIIASCVLIPTTAAWPAPWALLPVLATATVIVSGIGEEARFIHPLTNPVSVYIGDISYSLYLWHFPAIIFGHALYPQAGSLAYLGIVAAGFAIATAQYYAIERPLWKSPFGTAARRADWKRWWNEHMHSIQYGLVGGLVALSVAIIGTAFVVPPEPVQARPAPSASPSPGATVSPVDEAKQNIAEALNMTTWPTLSPSLDSLGVKSVATQWAKDACLSEQIGAWDEDPKQVAERCVYGSGDKMLYLIGDSTTISWAPAIIDAMSSQGWKIQLMTMAGCPFADVSVKGPGGGAFPKCDEFQDWVKQQVTATPADAIIVSMSDDIVNRLASNAKGDKARAQLAPAVTSALEHFASTGASVTVLGVPPYTASLESCYSATGSPAACVVPPSQDHADAKQMMVDAVGSTATFVDTDDLFCAQGQCPAFAGGVTIRADATHMTDKYSKSLSPAILEYLSAQLPS